MLQAFLTSIDNLEYSLTSDQCKSFVSMSKSPVCRIGSDINLILRSVVMS